MVKKLKNIIFKILYVLIIIYLSVFIPSFWGQKPLVVISGSMEPTLHVGGILYYEKLENGLEVFIIPKDNVNNIYATYSTKYGSNYNEFVPIGENKMVKVPLGIAHFLEHQLFNQEDGTDVMSFYSERGTDVNANTNKLKTTYLFAGPDFFEENLKYLLTYVESPYFTDES